jgi:predicted dehydrogenase
MMTQRWNVAVIGLGHWYSAYGLARGLAEYPQARLAAVAADDQAALDRFATTFKVPGYRDYRELLAREDVDIVHIAAPVVQIPDIAVTAARAGKHLVLGKPMAMTLADADRIVDAVEGAGVMCMPFQGIQRLRLAETVRRIRGGDIGELLVLHQTCRWSIAEDAYQSGKAGWFADPRFVPGGAFIDEGIYWIDFFCYLAGSAVASVQAKMANLVHKELEVEDWGMATFTFANGVVGTLEASWTINSPRKTGPSPKQNSVLRFEAVGSRGEIIEQFFRSPGRAMLAAGAADWVFERQAEAPAYNPPVPFPLGHLVECLNTGTPPIASVREARAAFAAALGAYESARLGRTVDLVVPQRGDGIDGRRAPGGHGAGEQANH